MINAGADLIGTSSGVEIQKILEYKGDVAQRNPKFFGELLDAWKKRLAEHNFYKE